MVMKQEQGNQKTRKRRSNGFLERILGFDTSEAITFEDDVAARAYENLLDLTRSTPPKELEDVRGRAARNLIKRIWKEEENYKQAIAMWKEFNKRLPHQVTDKHYPPEPGS